MVLTVDFFVELVIKFLLPLYRSCRYRFVRRFQKVLFVSWNSSFITTSLKTCFSFLERFHQKIILLGTNLFITVVLSVIFADHLLDSFVLPPFLFVPNFLSATPKRTLFRLSFCLKKSRRRRRRYCHRRHRLYRRLQNRMRVVRDRKCPLLWRQPR